MLARSAAGLYWIGRHLERAEHLCRLLWTQVEALVDRPVQEIHAGWRRIYRCLRRAPPVGGAVFDGDDDYTLADSYTLADDLTFERSNPDSLRSCFVNGRENARQMRHCISSEMWTCLNLAYLRISKLSIQDIWRASPETFYADTAREINTFAGVAEATMYRDEGWRFMRLGRCVERAQLAAALMLSQIQLANAAEDEADWTGLLRVYQALEAYNRRQGLSHAPDRRTDLLVADPLLPPQMRIRRVEPQRVVDLLVMDPLLPRSLRNALDGVEAELAGLDAGPDARASSALRRLAGRLCALVQYDWPDQEASQQAAYGEALLLDVQARCLRLHELATAAYFDYQVEDALQL